MNPNCAPPSPGMLRPRQPPSAGGFRSIQFRPARFPFLSPRTRALAVPFRVSAGRKRPSLRVCADLPAFRRTDGIRTAGFPHRSGVFASRGSRAHQVRCSNQGNRHRVFFTQLSLSGSCVAILDPSEDRQRTVQTDRVDTAAILDMGRERLFPASLHRRRMTAGNPLRSPASIRAPAVHVQAFPLGILHQGISIERGNTTGPCRLLWC